MEAIELIFLSLLVIGGVFLTGWLTPFIILVINRLLIINIEPILILLICVLAAILGDLLLWHFDYYLHKLLDKKLNIKRPKHIKHHKNTAVRKIGNYIWEKIQNVKNQKLLFPTIFIASFSIIPDFFIVEFARKKMKKSFFVLAMFLGKFVVYSPLIWGSLGILKLVDII